MEIHETKIVKYELAVFDVTLSINIIFRKRYGAFGGELEE
jgi:hypothetical protein